MKKVYGVCKYGMEWNCRDCNFKNDLMYYSFQYKNSIVLENEERELYCTNCGQKHIVVLERNVQQQKSPF